MLPTEHSKIQQQAPEFSSSQSDLQSLHDLRELLPPDRNIKAFNHYLIPTQNQQLDPSWSSIQNQQSKQLLTKIIQQTHQLISLKQQLYYYKTSFFQVTQDYTQLKEQFIHLKQSQQNHTQMVQELHQKIKKEKQQKQQLQLTLNNQKQEITTLQQQNLKLKTEANAFEHHIRNNVQEQLEQQARINMELMAKNQKILRINALLKEELHIAEKKLVRIEAEQQENACGILYQQIEKLKENHNLINHKEDIQLPKYQSKEQEKRTKAHFVPFDPFEKQDTLKLSSNRQSNLAQDFLRRQSKTIQKDRLARPSLHEQKLRPLQEPKPQRKYYLGPQFCKKYQRGGQL